MKKLLIMLFGLSMATFSCTKKNEANVSEVETSPKEESHCYIYMNEKDLIKLQTFNDDGKITGTLEYAFFEKDKSRGTINGEMQGNLLVAEYKFESEGTVSVRQIAFKKTEDGMREGVGPIEEKDGKILLKSLDSLSFDNSFLLKEVPNQE